jgi:hypothetical protein
MNSAKAEFPGRERKMPLRRFLPKHAAFGPADLVAMITAYELALRQLGLHKKVDAVTEPVARKIIELAMTGERDPEKLCEATVKSFNDGG